MIQAPMGWIARSALASAVSNAGGLGVIDSVKPVAGIIAETVAEFQSVIQALGRRYN